MSNNNTEPVVTQSPLMETQTKSNLYPIMVVTVLLLLMWYFHKCWRKEHMSKSYGGVPIRIVASPYIDVKPPVVRVPNSKTAERVLTDTEEYKCETTAEMDSGFSELHFKKKNMASAKQQPMGLTKERCLCDQEDSVGQDLNDL